MAARGPRSIALWALALAGCYDGFDPLDPEVLAEVARSRGDAQGLDLSGLYLGEFEALDCGCEGVVDFDATLCDLAGLAQNFGQDQYFPVGLVQADGTVQLYPVSQSDGLDGADELTPTLYGPLDADGHISAAGVLRADGIIGQGQVLARLDGTLTGGPGDAELEVEYRQRYQVELVESITELDEGANLREIDCRERLALHMTWVAPVPAPLPPPS